MTNTTARNLWFKPLRGLGLVLALLVCAWARAGEGHSHGAEAPALAGTASPRVQAHSDLFELVGVVDNGQMRVYLDRYATNEPIGNARIEYESGAHKGLAEAQPDGTYLIKFAALSKPGNLQFSFAVTVVPQADLLVGELEIKPPRDDHAAQPERPWLQWLGAGAGALALMLMALLLGRRLATPRPARLN